MPVGITPIQPQKKKSFIDNVGDVASGIKNAANFATDAESFIKKIDTPAEDTKNDLDASNGQTLAQQIAKTPNDSIKRRFSQIGIA